MILSYQHWHEARDRDFGFFKDVILNYLNLDPKQGLSVPIDSLNAQNLKSKLQGLGEFSKLPTDVQQQVFGMIDSSPEENMNEYVMIRHGESEYNAHLTDNLDSPLTKFGEQQIRKTAHFLAENLSNLTSFVGITSPYLRCLQSARIIREVTGVEFEVDAGVREVMIQYDECSVPCRKDEFLEFQWPSDCGWTFFREQPEQFIQRIQEHARRVRTKNKALIVSHGTPVNTFFECLSGTKPTADVVDYVKNASISYIRGGQRIWFGKLPD